VLRSHARDVRGHETAAGEPAERISD
jgi:hypothetical protein